MGKIWVSDAVWEEIAKRGKFGETEDDVLRRVFGIEEAGFRKEDNRRQSGSSSAAPRPRYATRRMHAGVHRAPGTQHEYLLVSFHSGPDKQWELPDRSDKTGIRTVRDEAVKFALENGASDPGQTTAVMKALTSASYHLTK